MDLPLESFARDFPGVVAGPATADYETGRRALLALGSPAAVLRPRGAEGVRAALRLASDAGVPLSVRGGGHGFAGFCTNDGGVVLDLADLGGVEVVDGERYTVRVGGGATWGAVADALASSGSAISSGDTRSVGVGGLTLGGGIGWKVRNRGLALDNLVAAEVVTADGRVLRASESEHPDLFWALRGGGGNFGVVTAFEFRAHPTTEVFHGTIRFPAAEAHDVLHGWAEHLRVAPLELTSTVELANPFEGGPDAPVAVGVVFDGDDVRLASEAIDPLRALGTVLADDVALVPFGEVLVDGALPPLGVRFVSRNAFVDRSGVDEAVRVLADAATSPGAPAVSVRSVGGAVSRVADDATAYAHRSAELMVATTVGGPPPMVEAAVPGLDSLWARLAPHVGGSYANFLTGAAEGDVAAVYPAATYERLAEVKRRYDPDNLFARNHNVRPSAMSVAAP
ncbi:FAD-binding oxidoreductase [Luteimicrobium xylanilyticum]|uniref:(S)-2-hydroxy-acid oxidase n=1 Tax=Luteimicrobium xylanilyticum TaxID=1133546 RepID=A0A5P9Q6E9_9MICO|nr:FAD-binding oxidoreductase [Luteimicrobium xylanilyticum]QFU96977.1 (S)-2-hydroxy-acid oxidase [Luteimicrobium xylanilyticum]